MNGAIQGSIVQDLSFTIVNKKSCTALTNHVLPYTAYPCEALQWIKNTQMAKVIQSLRQNAEGGSAPESADVQNFMHCMD